jgi:endonuclease YncB( thermonuclease family)
MVTLGHAWVMRKYYGHLPKHRQAQLNKLEHWAKSKRVGLWKAPDPEPPWNWRQKNKGDTEIIFQSSPE